LPAAGLACIVAGLGAPSRAWACAVVMAAWLAAAGSISLPLAMRQREVPPIEHQLVDFVRASGGAPATVLDRRGELLADLLDGAVERAVVREPGLAARTRELEAAGRRVYSTAPAPDRPQDWRPVARFCWNEPLDLRAAKEVWLFLHGPGAPPGPPPECYRFTASASTIR
jgi:hypothetical protein